MKILIHYTVFINSLVNKFQNQEQWLFATNHTHIEKLCQIFLSLLLHIPPSLLLPSSISVSTTLRPHPDSHSSILPREPRCQSICCLLPWQISVPASPPPGSVRLHPRTSVKNIRRVDWPSPATMLCECVCMLGYLAIPCQRFKIMLLTIMTKGWQCKNCWSLWSFCVNGTQWSKSLTFFNYTVS